MINKLLTNVHTFVNNVSVISRKMQNKYAEEIIWKWTARPITTVGLPEALGLQSDPFASRSVPTMLKKNPEQLNNYHNMQFMVQCMLVSMCENNGAFPGWAGRYLYMHPTATKKTWQE